MAAPAPTRPVRRRNDVGQYDDLADQWWRADGDFAALHWLAAARGRIVPRPIPGAVAVDLGCGGGLMAPHLRGYRHIGIDLSLPSLAVAAHQGMEAVAADVTAVPLPDGIADVVVAGEIFEHVVDLEATVAEAARLLRPGGILVCDTINDTWWSRFSLVSVGERMPGGPPPRCHDPELFVPPQRLIDLCALHRVELHVRGLRPSVVDYLAFLVAPRRAVRMVPTRSLAALYQGKGRKQAP